MITNLDGLPGVTPEPVRKLLETRLAARFNLTDEVDVVRALNFAVTQLIINNGDDAMPMPSYELRKRRMEGQRMHDQWVRAEIVKRDTSERNSFEIHIPASPYAGRILENLIRGTLPESVKS